MARAQPLSLPNRKIPEWSTWRGSDKGRARAMLLDHGAGDIYWEEAFDTCEELSWYIVDAMPWLLPQHIRYVGQECSTLKRAIQKGECYEQG